VHGERRHADVRLVTVRTRPGVPTVGQTAVGLLVTRKIARRRVLTTALRTHVPDANRPATSSNVRRISVRGVNAPLPPEAKKILKI